MTCKKRFRRELQDRFRLPAGRAAVSTSDPRSPGRRNFCEAEVEYFREAVLGHHDVGRLQVAVDHTRLMCGGESLGNLGREIEKLLSRQRPRQEEVSQSLPFDELRDDVGDGIGQANVVNDKMLG